MVGEVGVGRFSRGLPLLPFFPPSFFSFFLLALALPSLTGFKKMADNWVSFLFAGERERGGPSGEGPLWENNREEFVLAYACSVTRSRSSKVVTVASVRTDVTASKNNTADEIFEPL